MDKELGQEYKNPIQREAFLKDNCDGCEQKGYMKPLQEQRKQMVSNIKAKAEYVTEICYRFTDQETKETGYYNKDGKLVESRPATADELQPTIFGVVRNLNQPTGTDN